MTRVWAIVAVAVSLAAPARADLTIVQTVSGKGMGMGGTTKSTSYLKGLKMRTDTVSGNTTRTMIFDVESQKIYIFDSKKKEADVWDMAEFNKQAGGAVDVSEMKASITPNGQTKQVSGRAASGYDMAISVPARLGGAKDGMAMTVNLTGPVWIVKGAPGTDEYMKFYQAAAERGWIFSDPRAAKGQPGQARAMTEMYRQMVATGGIAYETNVDVKMSGEGPMAGLMSRMGNISMTTVVDSIEVAPAADDLFAPPAGYKLSPKK